ncbi:S41 family peptidase [Patescibacteria group bacterium]|nr:S41 family peptidase [Patescibacteria group bacterium]
MRTRKLQLLLVVLISALIGYYIGVSKISLDWRNYHPSIIVSSKEPPPSVSNVNFSMFWNVLEKIETSYYDKKAIDPQKLVNGAISGMVQSLGDPYTIYLPPVQNTDFKNGMAGKFEGIGAELGMNGKQIVVVAPLSGSPAEKAGVKAGDSILKVEDQVTAGWSLSQAVEKIRGPKGTVVNLSILHKESAKPENIKITRDTITVKSITDWVKKIKDVSGINIKNNGDMKVAYIRLSQFGDNTNQEWLAFSNKLSLEIAKDKNIKGLILDLRNNPGGYLTDATFIASEFIDSGVVVIEEKGSGDKNSFSVNRKGLLLNIPLVVLINKGSASASEIVAGALRDHKRAKLVGETSFGKGTIQQAEDLGAGAGLHVTIAKWLTPDGVWVHGKGLTPDISVDPDQKDQSHDAQLEKAVEELIK